MIVCRSSIFLAVTRIWSAWIAAWTLRPVALIILTNSLAFSWGIPLLIETNCLAVPPSACSILPNSKNLIDICRLASLSCKTLTTFLSLNSSSETRLIFSPSLVILLILPLKSKRLAISFIAIEIALSTSCRFGLLTISNE